uniref:TAFA chemokine like family member 5, like n=1 Tax=Cyprinus carpio TaxID=7962 RepID=A0A8C1WFK8_CYPCA
TQLWNDMRSLFLMSCFLKCIIVCVSSTGQLAVGTCEIVMLNRDSSQPKRTIARQTARCACRRGQIAGTTRARPACVDARIVKSKQWCEMSPCSEGEICGLLFNRSGWTCTKGATDQSDQSRSSVVKRNKSFLAQVISTHLRSDVLLLV